MILSGKSLAISAYQKAILFALNNKELVNGEYYFVKTNKELKNIKIESYKNASNKDYIFLFEDNNEELSYVLANLIVERLYESNLSASKCIKFLSSTSF